jgi:hypothetical protein
MSESASSETEEPFTTAVVNFGRPVTEDDLQKLRSVTDALEAKASGRTDEDHVHKLL